MLPPVSRTIVFSQVTGDNWGAHFTISGSRRDSRGYVYVDYPAHVNCRQHESQRSFGSYDVVLTLNTQDFDVVMIRQGDLYLHTRRGPLAVHWLRYSVSARTSTRRLEPATR